VGLVVIPKSSIFIAILLIKTCGIYSADNHIMITSCFVSSWSSVLGLKEHHINKGSSWNSGIFGKWQLDCCMSRGGWVMNFSHKFDISVIQYRNSNITYQQIDT